MCYKLNIMKQSNNLSEDKLSLINKSKNKFIIVLLIFFFLLLIIVVCFNIIKYYQSQSNITPNITQSNIIPNIDNNTVSLNQKDQSVKDLFIDIIHHIFNELLNKNTSDKFDTKTNIQDDKKKNIEKIYNELINDYSCKEILKYNKEEDELLINSDDNKKIKEELLKTLNALLIIERNQYFLAEGENNNIPEDDKKLICEDNNIPCCIHGFSEKLEKFGYKIELGKQSITFFNKDKVSNYIEYNCYKINTNT